MTLPAIYTFGALLIVHFVADFVFQSHWMATNKSKSNKALALHVLAYSCVLQLAALALFWSASLQLIVLFVAVNTALHFVTDYFTSRWSSQLWGEQRWHDFFVVVGLDQLIHQLTLAATMLLIFGGAS